MTLPASGPLDMTAINAEFGLGTDMSAYVGARWYTTSATTGLFTSPLGFNQFYSKRATSPVTPGSQTFSTAGASNFTVPLYAVLTITLRGASGGGGGGSSNQSGGSNGSSGGNTSFGSYGYGQGGGGGYTGDSGGGAGTPGANSDGTPAGGAGGGGNQGHGSGGAGGAGGKTILSLTNQASGGTGLLQGSTVVVTVGAGGPGGAGGSGVNSLGYPAPGGGGSKGSAGSAVVAWS